MKNGAWESLLLSKVADEEEKRACYKLKFYSRTVNTLLKENSEDVNMNREIRAGKRRERDPRVKHYQYEEKEMQASSINIISSVEKRK